MKVDNAIILAAGMSTRFAPLSYEMPKGLIDVKGEILIERQIRQIREAGINEIIVVTGYMSERFDYLKEKYGIRIVQNPEYQTKNNNSSIWYVRQYLKNSYVCSSDNYFTVNPFEKEVGAAYYSALFSSGETKEWCMREDADGYISSVTIGGRDAWYMLGHTFWSETFSKCFIEILEKEYDFPETSGKLWEQIYIEHIDLLKMRIRKYNSSEIYEFDTLDELRAFDNTYIDDTRSRIIKDICREQNCREREIKDIKVIKDSITNHIKGFSYMLHNELREYMIYAH